MGEGTKEYWFCVLGPSYRGELPSGADFPLRMAVQNAYNGMQRNNHEDYACSSGWGMTEEMKAAFDKLRSMKSFNPERYQKMINMINSSSINDPS